MKEVKLFINGQFRSSGDQRTYNSLNPANGEVIAQVHLPSESDINEAIDAAHRAFYDQQWRGWSQQQRIDALMMISEKIKEQKKEFIHWEQLDSGSTMRKSTADIFNSAAYFKMVAKQLQSFEFEKIDQSASREGFSKNSRRYEPIGVCAQIIPWNFPLQMAAWKIAPIIATGCTTVLKTAKETPVTAIMLAEILNDVGIPKGVVNIITGDAPEGQQLISSPKINKLAFTGSTEVGKKIYAAAAKNIKKISLELGGKSAHIICDDADLSIAVDAALYGFLYHSGQACTSGTRILVQDKIYDTFIEKLTKRVADIPLGDPSDKDTALGPVINQKQFDTIINYIQETKNEGAKLLFGGERALGGVFDKAFYIKPTAFEISPDNTIFHEEIFGPVAGITKFSTDEEAIALANNSRYGLAGGVWSKNLQRAHNIANTLETGTVWINEYHLLNAGMPFGGYKESGVGREMGSEGLLNYLEVKHVWQSDCDSRDKKPWLDAIF